jgi:DNA-binding MarR family transcriptional regulator
MQRLSAATTAESASPLVCAGAMLDAMPQVMWFIRRHMRRHRTRGMSIPQFRTLVLLDARPDACLSEVAENLGASRPTASRIVSGLVTKNLVERQICATDRRHCELKLTATGRAVLNAGRQATQERLAAELAGLGPAERAGVTDAMTVLGRVFGADAAVSVAAGTG